MISIAKSFFCMAAQGEGIKLFEYISGTTVGKWELVSETARPVFYDQNEDNEGL
jgi:hypothetical protein